MGQETYEIFKLLTSVAFFGLAAFIIMKNVMKKKSDKKSDKED